LFLFGACSYLALAHLTIPFRLVYVCSITPSSEKWNSPEAKCLPVVKENEKIFFSGTKKAKK